MNIGAVMLIGYLLYRFAKKKNAATSEVDRTVSEAEYSFRTIILSVLTIVAYFTLVFEVIVVCQPYLERIGLVWVRDSCFFIVSIILPLIVVRCGPPWLAWRLLRHLRHPLPARCAFWLTPGERKPALIGFARLIVASMGKDPFFSGEPPSALKKKLRVFFMLGEPGSPGDLDAWAVAARALHAEISGDPEKAARYLGFYDLFARRAQVPRFVRIFAFEQLALHAARREDWSAVARRAAFGSGRGMPLLRLLARAHLSGNVNRVLLLFCWIISPCRVATYPYLRSVLRRQGVTAAQTVPDMPDESFPVMHLRLLREAAEGRPIPLAQVVDLAVSWQSLLTPESYATYLARGLVAGARDSHGAIDAIPHELLTELEELVSAGTGDLPVEILDNWEDWRETLAGALILRLRNRLFSNVEDFAEQFFPDEDEETPPLLQCWERWLAMQDATERLGSLMGVDDLATAWYGGLQINAWNGACRVYNAYGKKSTWVSFAMFTWLVRVADKVGDEEAARVNRDNAALCGLPRYTTLEAFQEVPKRISRWLPERILRVCSGVWWRREMPRFWKIICTAALNRITVVLPLGGTLITVVILSAIWSFSDVFIGSLVALPLVVSGFVLLYLVAMRIEQKTRNKREDPS